MIDIDKAIENSRKWDEIRKPFECKTCRYFWPCMSAEEYSEDAEPELGQCRRMPPSFVDCLPDGDIGFWPLVKADEDWCGEWELRE